MSNFINENIEPILQVWEDFARTIGTPGMPLDTKLNVVFILTHHLVRMVVLHFAPALIVQARRWRAE